MDEIKLGFKMVDYAKSIGRGIGSVRLKDGSSVKILGDPNDRAIDFFRIKHGKLLEGVFYRGKDCVPRAASTMAYIEEKLALNPEDAARAWNTAFDVVV